MKAVKRFDPSVNVRLVSFAVHWIRARSMSTCFATGAGEDRHHESSAQAVLQPASLKKNLTWLSAEETAAVLATWVSPR